MSSLVKVMSRIGLQPVLLSPEVKAEFEAGTLVITGPKGELSLAVRSEIDLQISPEEIRVVCRQKDRFARSLFGTTRALINNMVKGVVDGFSKTLKLAGTGYRVEQQGEKIVLSLGFSHPVEYVSPSGITLEVPDKETIVISGADKALVGQAAATIRDFHKPEPYKGKGIRYENEPVRKKAGKAGKVGAAGVGA